MSRGRRKTKTIWIFALLFTISLPAMSFAQSACSRVFESYYEFWLRVAQGDISTTHLHAKQDHNYQPQPNHYADLRTLKDHKYSITKFEADRFYTNIDSYYPSLVHTLQIGNHNIEIIIPKNSRYERAADGIINAVTELPLRRIEALDSITLNTRSNRDDDYWKQTYQNFSHSSATAGNGRIDIYAISLNNFFFGDNEAVRITRHEFGHLIASKIFGSPNPTFHYSNVASRDTHQVSDYGRNSWAEDFAEGIEAYLRTHAGSLNPILRAQLKN